MVWSLVLFANEETLCHSFVDDGRKMIAAVAVYRPSVSAPRAPVSSEQGEKGRHCCLCRGLCQSRGLGPLPGQWAWLQEGSVSAELLVTGTPLKHLRQRPLFSLLVKMFRGLKPWKILFQLSTLVTKWRNMFISYIGQFFTHTVHSSSRNTAVHFKLSFF